MNYNRPFITKYTFDPSKHACHIVESEGQRVAAATVWKARKILREQLGIKIPV